MKQYPLIGISIIAVVILILASLTNVVGYQSVQSSNKQTIHEAINQRELLFQTIVDIVNNKEIQRIILKSQMNRGLFPVVNIPVITKNQLKQMYFIGLMHSKVFNKSKIHSMVQQRQISNFGKQLVISALIEKNPILKGEITLLQNSECDCGNKDVTRWRYPVLCSMLSIIFFGLGLTFVFFDKVISSGGLRDNPIFVLIAVLIWLEVGALLTTVDCLFNIYCGTEVLAL